MGEDGGELAHDAEPRHGAQPLLGLDRLALDLALAHIGLVELARTGLRLTLDDAKMHEAAKEQEHDRHDDGRILLPDALERPFAQVGVGTNPERLEDTVDAVELGRDAEAHAALRIDGHRHQCLDHALRHGGLDEARGACNGPAGKERRRTQAGARVLVRGGDGTQPALEFGPLLEERLILADAEGYPGWVRAS